MQNEPISVIIITHNEATTLGRLLSDLKAQTLQHFEVIIVDSNSDDGTVAIANEYRESFIQCKILAIEEKGVSLSRNAGVKQASHERLLFLDADIRLAPDFMEKAQGALRKTGLKVAAGRMKAFHEQRSIRWAVTGADYGLLLTQFVVPMALGDCLFSTKTVHQEIAGFDPQFKLCEGCDYVSRASRAYRVRMIPAFFELDTRRLEEKGVFQTGYTYLKANVQRWRHKKPEPQPMPFEIDQQGGEPRVG